MGQSFRFLLPHAQPLLLSSLFVLDFVTACIALAKAKRPSPSPSTDHRFSAGNTYPSPPCSLSDMDAMEAMYTFYYAGLPSSPRLVARTGTTPWARPTGMEAYHRVKELGIVTSHELNTSWEHNVAPKVIACLDEMGILWTSTDIVRIGVVGEESPVILWIGVKPKSLAGETADTAAFRCLDILNEFGITDVDVEIRESSVTRSAGPKLLPPVRSSNPTAAVRHPLTHALGLPISAEATPDIAGTGGFFMAEGGDSDELLLVTARHVVFPPLKGKKREKNELFERKNESESRDNVLLLGDKAYVSCLASIKASIQDQDRLIESLEWRLKEIQGLNNESIDKEREEAHDGIKEAKEVIVALKDFYNDVDKQWATPASRVIGHVVYSPPIRFGAGPEGYTEDFAIIKVNKDKIDRTIFKGNTIDLGTKIDRLEFTRKMYPNPRNRPSFRYPHHDRLLMLRGTISDEEMRKPTLLDQNDQPCLVVIKDGSTTGVTIGRASGIMSYARKYLDDGSWETSKEWAILSYDKKSGPFSEPGDSGAVIVDGLGRIGGLLTGGSGVTDFSDITYATPISFIQKSIAAKYPNAHLNPA